MNKSKVTSSLWEVWCGVYFLALFFLSLLLSIGKRSTLAKNLEGLQPPPVTPVSTSVGRVVQSCTSVYFVISKLILLSSYSFHVSCIILSNVYFYNVRSMFSFLFNRSQSKASVVNQMSHYYFEAPEYFFALVNFLKIAIFTTLFRRWST